MEDYSMPDLGNDVLIAIGSVSAEWATLEYYMSRVTLSAYDKYGKAPSKSLASISFYERQKAFRHAFEGENVAEDKRKFAQEIADKIGPAEFTAWQMQFLATMLKISHPPTNSSHFCEIIPSTSSPSGSLLTRSRP
jgi:hypothetical protein